MHSARHAVINPYAKIVSPIATPWLSLQVLTQEGQSSLPQACPICLHEPVKAEDCRPNKALRTTIKVFLKKKGIERETARKKEMVDQAAATAAATDIILVDNTPNHQPSQTPILPSAGDVEVRAEPTQGSNEVAQAPEAPKESDSQSGTQILPEAAQMDIARPSIEVYSTAHFEVIIDAT